MKALKALLLFVVLLIVLVVGIGFLLPATTQVERSVTIARKPTTVFQYVNSLKNFHEWSPWRHLDENMTVEFSGPETGEGASMAWRSELQEVGSGRQTIVESRADEWVASELDFGDMGQAKSYFKLNPSGDDTLVIWGFETDHGNNLISSYMGLMMDQWVGSAYEAGLDELKEVVESKPSIVTRELSYSAGGTDLQGYLAYPEGADGIPGVLVVHEWWGHNDYARHRAEMLAEQGYAAFALDMYGQGKVADHPKDANAFMMEIVNNAELATERFNAALSLLQESPVTDPEQMAAIGYCFGGGVVLSMARAGVELDGVVSFHGTLQGLAPVAQDVSADFLVFNGADDPFVTAEQITQFKEEMNAADVGFEFVDYPGVKHSFTNPGADEKAALYDLPLAYDAQADADSWHQTLAFFQRLFGPSVTQ